MQQPQNVEKIDRLQNQIRRFQTDLEETQEQLIEKIKSLEDVQIHQQSDLHHQLKSLTEQINNERNLNTKLNTDLAKSLELGLQLQLEIQSLKARNQQTQHEERKHSQTLQEKVRQVSHELELTKALHAEVESELSKARAKFQDEIQNEKNQQSQLQSKIEEIQNEKNEIIQKHLDLETDLKRKLDEIEFLTLELEKLSTSLTEVEDSSIKHYEAFKNLSSVAENKIVELKVALDRKTAECKDFEGHLHQAVTQNQLLKQENANLKDYISKINNYLQNQGSSPAQPSASI